MVDTVREQLINSGYVDIAPELGERLHEALQQAETHERYSAFADVNREFVGHNMHVIALESRNPALLLQAYECTPISERIRSQYNLRRLGFDNGVRRFRYSRDGSGRVEPIQKVASFTGKLLRLPDPIMRTGVFELERQSRFGKVVAYTLATAEMFDPKDFEPMIELYDLGHD